MLKRPDPLLRITYVSFTPISKRVHRAWLGVTPLNGMWRPDTPLPPEKRYLDEKDPVHLVSLG